MKNYFLGQLYLQNNFWIIIIKKINFRIVIKNIYF